MVKVASFWMPVAPKGPLMIYLPPAASFILLVEMAMWNPSESVPA